jgi:hypothetical protein
MTHEFEELALDGHNYPTRAMGVKISLALRRMYEAIVPPTKRIVPLLEYVMEEEPSMLWTALQTRYEQ